MTPLGWAILMIFWIITGACMTFAWCSLGMAWKYKRYAERMELQRDMAERAWQRFNVRQKLRGKDGRFLPQGPA